MRPHLGWSGCSTGDEHCAYEFHCRRSYLVEDLCHRVVLWCLDYTLSGKSCTNVGEPLVDFVVSVTCEHFAAVMLDSERPGFSREFSERLRVRDVAIPVARSWMPRGPKREMPSEPTTSPDVIYHFGRSMLFRLGTGEWGELV